MAGMTEDKLQLLENTKEGLKTAINATGHTVGDVFSEYPSAVTAYKDEVDAGYAQIAAAITDKGVPTEATDTPAQMATNIGAIETGTQIETVNFNFQNTVGSDIHVAFFNEELISIDTFNSGLFSVVKNSPICLYQYSYAGDIMIIPGGSYTTLQGTTAASIYSPSGDFDLTVIMGGGSG